MESTSTKATSHAQAVSVLFPLPGRKEDAQHARGNKLPPSTLPRGTRFPTKSSSAPLSLTSNMASRTSSCRTSRASIPQSVRHLQSEYRLATSLKHPIQGAKALGPEKTISGKVQETLANATQQAKAIDEQRGITKTAGDVSAPFLLLYMCMSADYPPSTTHEHFRRRLDRK